MTAFLFLSVPLVVATAYLNIGPRFAAATGLSARGGGDPTRDPAWPAVRRAVFISAVSFVPMYGLLLAIRLIPFALSPAGLIAEALVGTYGSWLAGQALLSFLIVRRTNRKNARVPVYQGYLIHLAVAGVLSFLLLVADAVAGDSYWSLHELFLKPIALASALVVGPVAVSIADNAVGGGWAALVLVVKPIVFAISAGMAEWNLPIVAIVVMLAWIAAAGGLMWYFLWKDKPNIRFDSTLSDN